MERIRAQSILIKSIMQAGGGGAVGLCKEGFEMFALPVDANFYETSGRSRYKQSTCIYLKVQADIFEATPYSMLSARLVVGTI